MIDAFRIVKIMEYVRVEKYSFAGSGRHRFYRLVPGLVESHTFSRSLSFEIVDRIIFEIFVAVPAGLACLVTHQYRIVDADEGIKTILVCAIVIAGTGDEKADTISLEVKNL